MTDFMAYHQQKITFNENGCYVILGRNVDRYGKSNGVGKSAIFVAIYAALYNQIRGKTLAQAIHAGAKGYKLELVLQSTDGTYYQILRSRRKDGTSTTFLFSDKTGEFKEDIRIDLTCHDQDDTQERINSLLKMNAKSFSHSVYFKEDMASAFARAKKGERFELIKNSLQIDQYDKIVKIAKVELDKINISVSEISSYVVAAESGLADIDNKLIQQNIHKNDLDTYYASLSEIDSKLAEIAAIKIGVSDLEQMRVTCTNKVKAAQTNLESSNNRFNDLNRKINEANIKLEEYRGDLAKLRIHYKTLFDNKKTISILPDEEVSKLNEAIAVCKADIKQNQGTIESSNEMIIALGKTKGTCCPTCTSTLDNKKRNILIDIANKNIESAHMSNAVSNKKMNDYNILIHGNNINLGKLNDTIKQLDQLTAKGNSIKEAGEGLKSIISSLQPELNVAAKHVQDYTEQLTNATIESTGVEQQISLKYDDKIESLLSTQKQELLSHIATSNQKMGILVESIRGIRESTKDIGAKQEALSALNTKKIVVENVIDSCSKKGGIPSILIGQALKEIEKYANQALSSFDDYDTLSIKFITSKPDEIDIMVRKDPESDFREFDTFSGAERFIVSFAIRMAMSEILSHKYGSDLKFILLDEAGTALDEYNMGLFANMLKRMSTDKLVLCITHQRELKDHIPQTILVKRSGGKSEIVVNNKEEV